MLKRIKGIASKAIEKLSQFNTCNSLEIAISDSFLFTRFFDFFLLHRLFANQIVCFCNLLQIYLHTLSYIRNAFLSYQDF